MGRMREIELKPEAGYRYRPLAVAIKRALLDLGAVWLTAR